MKPHPLRGLVTVPLAGLSSAFILFKLLFRPSFWRCLSDRWPR